MGYVKQICKPGTLQSVLYNGHKRVHAIKFQSVVATNGLIANLYGPVEGTRHDSGMFADSRLFLSCSCTHSHPLETLCVYTVIWDSPY